MPPTPNHQPPTTRRGWRRLSSSRALVIDILHYARKVPSQAVVRYCDLAPLVAARRMAGVKYSCPSGFSGVAAGASCGAGFQPASGNGGGAKISWTILFLRAYALLGAKTPQLRQTYMAWPWPHIYQHDQTACMMAISREHRGEDRLFFGLFRTPEERTLPQLQSRLDVFKTQPIPEVREFKGQRLLSSLPRPLRRLVWWLALHVSGCARVRHLGTFGITTVGSLDAISIHAPTIQTTMLSFGPISADGKVRVTMVYDHRVMDGAQVARCLAELERILCGVVAEEVRALTQPTTSHAASTSV
jgi:hypothetical protein